MPVRPILLHGPSFLSTVLKTFGQLARIFWANGLPPLLAKNCPYAYASREIRIITLIGNCHSFIHSFIFAIYQKYNNSIQKFSIIH